MATTTEYVEEYYEPNELIVDRTISPEDHIKASEIEKGLTTRHLFVNKSASLQQLADGTVSSTWKIPEEQVRQAIFQRVAHIDPETAQIELTGDLDKVVILEAEVSWMRNSFPVDMAADVSGMRGKTFTGQDTDGVALVIPKNATTPLTVNKQIFEPENVVTRDALQNRLPVQLDFDNRHFREHPDNEVIEDPLEHKYMVNNASTLGEILHANAEIWGISPQLAPGVADWYTAPKPFIDAVIAQFKDNVKYSNLGDLEITFKRADNEPFASTQGIAGRYGGHDARAQKTLENVDLQSQYDVGFELKLTYFFAN